MRKRWLVAAAAGVLLWKRLHPADIAGDVALITGGSRGLGLLIAEELARHGCRIVICARDALELERAAKRLEAAGAEVLAVPCDIADSAQVHDMVARAEQKFGVIDILVNNAGVIQVGPLEAMSLNDFRQALDVNFMGAVHTTLAVLDGMRARRSGRIVNITSIGGKVPIPHLLPYDCAKFALVGFSEGLHAELARYGIHVTTIVPGLMRTGSPAQAQFKGRAAREFTWFALGGATPLTSMSAERAARRIVLALRRAEVEVTLTWQAKLLRLAHHLAPGTTARTLGWVNRALPSMDHGIGPGADAQPGMRLATAAAPSALTRLSDRAALRNNEYGGSTTPSPRHARQAGLED